MLLFFHADEIYSGIANGRVLSIELYTHRNQKYIYSEEWGNSLMKQICKLLFDFYVLLFICRAETNLCVTADVLNLSCFDYLSIQLQKRHWKQYFGQYILSNISKFQHSECDNYHWAKKPLSTATHHASHQEIGHFYRWLAWWLVGG